MNSEWTRMLVLAALFTFGATAASAQPTSFFGPGGRFAFHDDHDNRRLADIRLKLVERDGQRSLQLVIAAFGPLVEPIAGYRGVKGWNRHTAEQFENILAERFAFHVKTQQEDGSAQWSGVWREGRRGHIPQPRLGRDGRIAFDAMTPRDYPLELIVDTLGVRDGRQTTELHFDSVARMRLSYIVAGNQIRVVGFDSVADTIEARPAQPGKEEKLPPFKFPVSDADWKARDLEGKWVLFKATVEDDDIKAKQFVKALAERKEFELLEMITLYQPQYDGGIVAAWALARADAPQWLRATAWMRFDVNDHGEPDTKKILVVHNPPKARAWLERYADEATMSKEEKPNPRRDGEGQPLLGDLLALKRNNVKAGDLGDALPPFKPSEVFRHLDAPADVAVFGNRAAAEPGKVYVHQVQRAIRGVVQSGKFREPWIGKVRKLIRHPNTEIRQAAFLAITEFAQWMDPKDDAVDECRKIMDDPKESPAIRESALLAFSYFRHPQVYVRIHELIYDANYPLWRAAVLRANGIGNEFTLEHMNRFEEKLTPRDAEVFVAHRQQLQKWVDDPQRDRSIDANKLWVRIERAAWAEHVKSPLAKTLAPWTRTTLVKHPGDFNHHLEMLHNTYAPMYNVPDPQALTRGVRNLAAEILFAPERNKKKAD